MSKDIKIKEGKEYFKISRGAGGIYKGYDEGYSKLEDRGADLNFVWEEYYNELRIDFSYITEFKEFNRNIRINRNEIVRLRNFLNTIIISESKKTYEFIIYDPFFNMKHFHLLDVVKVSNIKLYGTYEFFKNNKAFICNYRQTESIRDPKTFEPVTPFIYGILCRTNFNNANKIKIILETIMGIKYVEKVMDYTMEDRPNYIFQADCFIPYRHYLYNQYRLRNREKEKFIEFSKSNKFPVAYINNKIYSRGNLYKLYFVENENNQ